MPKLSSDSDHVGLSRLLLNTGRAYVNRADHFMERIGLYRGQAILLLILSEQDGLTHSELAKKLGISLAATTKVINRLEALNYLQRQADPSDKRISRVFLKDEGWGVIHQIQAVFDQIDQTFFTNISNDEQDILRVLLTRMGDNLQPVPHDPDREYNVNTG